MNNAKKIFEEANELRDRERYDESIDLYQELLLNNAYDRFEILLQIGGSCYFSKRYLEAYQYYKEAAKMNESEEVASLGYYLACTKIDKLEEGLLELKRYTDKYSPKLYIDSINELKEGLKKGYATDYEDIILNLNS